MLKHKTQNIISVLCLAVGVVCFSLTTYYTRRIYNTRYIERNRCTVFQNDNYRDMMPPEMVKKLLTLQGTSFQYFYFSFSDSYPQVDVVDLNDSVVPVNAQCWVSTANYFVNCGCKSAITGKSLGKQKNGTVIVSDEFVRKNLGKGVNPIGYTLKCQSYNHTYKSYRITDVLCTKDFMRSGDFGYKHIFVFDEDRVNEYINEYIEGDICYLQPYVWVNEGFSGEDVENELKKICPDINVNIHHRVDAIDPVDFFLALFLLLGSSILVISIAGFLKLTLQLFNMRNREIALRRCMGAHTYQLIVPLVIETVIVFLVALIISIGLTEILNEILFSVVNVISRGEIDLNVPVVLGDEVIITFISLTLFLVVSIASVYRTTHSPLGYTVGKNRPHSGIGRDLMLIVQYWSCIFFLSAIVLILSAMIYIIRDIDLSDKEINTLQRCAIVRESFHKPIENKKFDGMKSAICICAIKLDKDSIACNDSVPNDDYVVVATEKEYFNLMGKDVIKMPTQKEIKDKNLVPVFAANTTIRKMDGMNYVPSVAYIPAKYRLEEYGYRLIGYTSRKNESRAQYTLIVNVDAFLIADDKSEIESLCKNLLFRFSDKFYIYIAEEGKYDKMIESVKVEYQKSDVDAYNKIHKDDMRIPSLYEAWYSNVIWAEIVMKCGVILTVVSILCIILSVYSAVSLDTARRRREVAIRKINGAKRWQIVFMFSKYYLRLIGISMVLALPFPILCFYIMGTFISHVPVDANVYMIIVLLVFIAALVMLIVTAFTIWRKIYNVAKLKPADVMRSE